MKSAPTIFNRRTEILCYTGKQSAGGIVRSHRRKWIVLLFKLDQVSNLAIGGIFGSVRVEHFAARRVRTHAFGFRASG